MCGLTVIVSVASPAFHIASAQARARSSSESAALTFTTISPGRAGLVGTSLLNCTFSRLVMMRSHHGVNDPCGRQIAFEIANNSGTSMMSAPKKPDGPPVTVEAHCVRLPAKADDPASLAPVIERRRLSWAANEVLIEVRAAAVNPSDVKAATGMMPYAVFPR